MTVTHWYKTFGPFGLAIFRGGEWPGWYLHLRAQNNHITLKYKGMRLFSERNRCYPVFDLTRNLRITVEPENPFRRSANV